MWKDSTTGYIQLARFMILHSLENMAFAQLTNSAYIKLLVSI